MSDGLMDAPNQQAVGLDPPWVEGTGGSGGATAEPQQTDLSSLTKAELLDRAQARGISPANNDMTKAELLDALEQNEE